MDYPSYTYPTDTLFTGSSLGNFLTFARLNAETDLEGLWSAADDQFYAGRWRITFACDGRELQPQETVFAPESQTSILNHDGLTIEKQFFIPFSRDRRSILLPSVLQRAVYLIRLKNASSRAINVMIHHELTFPAHNSPLFQKQPLAEQLDKRFEIHEYHTHCTVQTRGKLREVRVIRSRHPWSRVSHDDSSLVLDYQSEIPAGGFFEFPFVLAYSSDGIESAIAGYCASARPLLEESIRQYKTILARSFIATPNPRINRGLQWAKVNTVRVQHRYTSGFGFTNDPPQDIVVVRDVAWYIIGSDYVTPEFSRQLLTLCEQHAFHSGGKLTEYIHANEQSPELHDYNLNINDNTPLFVHASNHHALTTGDDARIRHSYPFMKRASDWILSQVKDGLVTCHADGTNVWGISGWRNIIDNYNLSGAVTEINAECYHALHCTADAARRLGYATDADLYREAAGSLRRAINDRLLSEKTGMYLLNHANDGSRRHDITGDLIFTIMFGVALPEVAERILKKLTDEDMWTPYGSRTVSKSEQAYHPDFGYQLLGGVWPNLTAWTAFCLRNDQPGLLVEGMENIYKYCEPDRPIDFVNVVPGQFPERIHGENYSSRGMAMSPWMPPTYLWLGIEGLLGVKPLEDGLEMNPAIPPGWNWVAVRDLPVKGKAVTAFLFDGILYADYPVRSRYPTKIGTIAPTSSTDETVFSIAMLLESGLVLFVASDRAANGIVTVHHDGGKTDRKVDLHDGEAQLIPC